MISRKKTGMLLLSLILIIAVCGHGSALMNPSAVYCHALGYEYVIETTEKGEVGFCKFPGGETVDAWDFLSGETALNRSYCAREGYEAKHVGDSKMCRDCTVCTLPNGTEVEATRLMGLTFRATTCGDGTCGFPENSKTCPDDCPIGGWDSYCDAIEDGKCDPDCEKEMDPDCGTANTSASTGIHAAAQAAASSIGYTPLLYGAVLLIIAAAALLLYRRRTV